MKAGWAAYGTNESGWFEIVVQPFPAAGRQMAGVHGRRHPAALKGGWQATLHSATILIVTHLDSIIVAHHDVIMRTTVTLDKDVEKMLRDAMHSSRRSFKEMVNAAIRAGLSKKSTGAKRTPFKVKAKPMGLRAGLDPTALNKIADELEVHAIVSAARRAKQK